MKYQNIRKEIKKLSEEQKSLKPQRKTVNCIVNRSMTSIQATYKVMTNSYRLRHLFAAYAKMKGIDIPQPKKKEFSLYEVDRLYDLYSESKVA